VYVAGNYNGGLGCGWLMRDVCIDSRGIPGGMQRRGRTWRMWTSISTLVSVVRAKGCMGEGLKEMQTSHRCSIGIPSKSLSTCKQNITQHKGWVDAVFIFLFELFSGSHLVLLVPPWRSPASCISTENLRGGSDYLARLWRERFNAHPSIIHTRLDIGLGLIPAGINPLLRTRTRQVDALVGSGPFTLVGSGSQNPLYDYGLCVPCGSSPSGIHSGRWAKMLFRCSRGSCHGSEVRLGLWSGPNPWLWSSTTRWWRKGAPH